MKNIIIIGSSGHAKVCIDILELRSEYNISGFIDDFRKPGDKVFDRPILGTLEQLPSLTTSHNVSGYLIAIGDNFQRYRVAQIISNLSPQLKPINAVHPSSYISKHASLGLGCVISAGAIINPSSSLGNHCIINTNASIDHDCTLDSFSSVAPGATLGGNVNVGTCSSICIGATVIEKITVGSHSVIGAGAVVLNDIPNQVVAHGVPAKISRERAKDERYI